MHKRVLIPTDYSNNAYNAIVYAFGLFANEPCTFHIFHAYFLARSARGNILFPEPEPREYDAAARDSGIKMQELKKRLGRLADNPEHTVYFDHKFGMLIDLLEEKVGRDKIDLIVMGTRGRTDDEKVAYGRNSINVMENIRDCAVLAVPANISYKRIEKIVFPTNFKTHFQWKDMRTFRELAQLENSTVQILHMGKEDQLSEKQRENKDGLENLFKGTKYTYHWLEDKKVKEGVLSFADQQNSGMIAFINGKHWFFGSVFSNPLVKSLGIHSRIPVLALHDSRNVT